MKKKEVIFIICLIIILIIVLSIVIGRRNNTEAETVNDVNVENNVDQQENTIDTNTENNVDESQEVSHKEGVKDDVSLKQVSIDGIKIGDKIEQDMKVKTSIEDPNYKYTYDEININADDNDNINYLSFFSENAVKTISDVNIKYNDTQLKSVADFKKNLGEGKKEQVDSDYFLVYIEDEIELRIYVAKEKVISIVMRAI